ncbi:carboxylate--amine ligase [Streptomyces sp. P3]|uniref:ATP-grasp domain-containing protein n=1 Tax=Streptomyces sp. P3 TaxID=2135430 RepID=UPI000D1AE0CA|nr:ATP-grasp domain-containing protein [Streptomyces sp. P3]AVV41391.1 carboxylate--amine ligase [Streptomyces sp. P3]
MSEHVLVVGSGRDLPGRVRAAAPGNRTTVICRLDYLSRLRERDAHSRVLAVRHDAPDREWVAIAAAVHAVDPFTRIATFGERDQDRCAEIGRALGLHTHSPRTVALVHDKAAMRARLRETGTDPTPSAKVTDLEALRVFVTTHGVPCVVKPTHGSASVGVAVLRSAEEHELAAALTRAGGDFYGLSGAGVVAERFHEGPQFSVEAFSEDGEHVCVAITRKYSDPDRFVELGHVVPAPLPPETEDEVRGYVPRVLDALDIAFGATHTEIVLTEAGPRVIETHLRMGGDEIPALVRSATGVDLADLVARQAAGERVLPGLRKELADGRTPAAAAIWFAAAPAAGVLTSVEGVDEARRTAGVEEVVVQAEPGTVCAGLESSEERLAFARAAGASAEEAVGSARAALAALAFHIRTVPSIEEAV